MKIKQQPNGTYTVHFNGKYVAYLNGIRLDYPALRFERIQDVKCIIRHIVAPHRVVFIHLLPRTWWVVKW